MIPNECENFLNPVALNCIDKQLSSCRHQREGLLQARAIPFAGNKLLKNGEHLFAIAVDTFQIITKTGFESGSAEPFVKQWFRDIDIATQCFHRVAAQKQTVKHRRLALGS
jgi:hypothetical protein